MAAPLIYDYRNLPVYKRDEDFLFKAISYKQGKLDANRAKLQGLYDQYSMMEATNDVDKEYIAQRLNEVKNIADQYAAGDMSSDYLTQNLMGNLDKVVDENVINAIVSTKRLASEDQAWARLEQENPEKFHQANKQYAYSQNKNREEYLNSQEVGAVYRGGTEVIEFVDVNKLITDNMEKITKQLKGSYVKVINGEYAIVDETGKRIDRRKLRAAIDGLLGPKERKQLEVNAWEQYSSLSEDLLKEQFEAYNSGQAETYRDRLAEVENWMKTKEFKNSDPEIQADTKELAEEYKNEIERMTSPQMYESMAQYGRKTVENYLYTNRLMNGFLDAYDFNEVTKIEVNKAYKYYNDNLREDAKIAREARAAEARAIEEAGGGVPEHIITDLNEGQGYERTVENALRQKQAASQGARDDFQEAISEYSPEQQKEINDFLMRSGIGEISSTSSIEYTDSSGVKQSIALSKETVISMYEYKQVLAGETASDKTIERAFLDGVKEVGEVLAPGFKKENLDAFYNDYRDIVPLISGSYKKQADGSFKFEVAEDDSKALETTAKLFGESGGLTEEEKVTKEVYQMATLLADPSLTKEERIEFERVYARKLRQMGADAPVLSVYATSNLAKTGGGVSSLVEGLLGGVFPSHGRGKAKRVNLKVEEGDIDYERMVSKRGEVPVGEISYVNIMGLSDLDKSKWETGGWGQVLWNTPFSDKTPSTVMKVMRENLKNNLEETDLVDGTLPTPKKMTFNAKSKEAADLRSLASAKLDVGKEGIDLTQDVSLNQVYNEESGMVDAYTIEFFGKGEDKAKVKTEEIPAKEIEQILPMANTSRPIINRHVPGQSFQLGAPRDYLDKAKRGVNKDPRVVRNIQEVQSFMQETKDNFTSEQDIRILDGLYERFYRGDIKFEIATTEDKQIVVNVRDGGQLHTSYGLVSGGQIHAFELTDDSNLTSLQSKAFYEYVSSIVDDLELTRLKRKEEDENLQKLR